MQTSRQRSGPERSGRFLLRIFEFRTKCLFQESNASTSQLYFSTVLKYALVFVSTCHARAVASFSAANKHLADSLFTMSLLIFVSAVFAEGAFVITRSDWWVTCYRHVRNPLFNVFFPLLSILAGEKLSDLGFSLGNSAPVLVLVLILVHRIYTGNLSNCLPFSSLESAIRQEEFYIDVTLYIAQFAHMMINKREDNSVAYQTLSAVSLLAYLTFLHIFIRLGVYFSTDFNKLHAICISFLIMFKLMDFFDIQNSRTRQCVVFIIVIACPLITRITTRVNGWHSKIDVFDMKLSPSRLYHGCILLHRYLNTEASSCSTDHDKDLLVYYQGLWKHYLRRSLADLSDEPLTPAQTTNHLVQYLINHPVLKSNSTISKLVLILHATQPAYFYRTMNQYLSALTKNYSNSLSDQYCIHLIREVWEAKLKAIEIGVVLAKSQSNINVFQVMDTLKIIIDLKVSGKFNQQDIQNIFDSVERLKFITDQVEKTFERQLQIFELLDKETDLDHKKIQLMNKTTLDLRKSLSELIKRQSKMFGLYSYFYPIIMTFYCVLMHDYDKTSSFLQAYKHKLSVLLDHITRRSNYSLTERIETDSVVIKVALERDKIGVITNVSLNVNHFLGEFEKEELLGKSVNCFLPEKMAEIHLETMQSDKVIPILNKNRPFLINDLHGNMKEVIMTIKLASQTTNTVCGYGLMTFETKFKGPSLLLDDRMNILSCNSSFNRILEQLGFSRKVIQKGEMNLSVLSTKLASSIKVVKKLIEYITTSPELRQDLDFAESNDSSDQVKNRLYMYLKAIVDQNRGSGMVYHLGNDSPLERILGSHSIHARFEVGSMLGMPIIRAFISSKVGEELYKSIKDLPAEDRAPGWRMKSILTISESSNKVVRLRQTELDDYNSENKQSIIDLNLQNMAVQKNTNQKKVCYFEDCLAPAGQLVKAASSFLKRRNTKGDFGEVENTSRGEFRHLNTEEDLFFEHSPVKREVLSILKWRNSSFELFEEAKMPSNQKPFNFGSDRVKIQPLGGYSHRKESNQTTDKEISSSSNTLLNKNKPRIDVKKITQHPPTPHHKEIFKQLRSASGNSFLSQPVQRKPKDLKKATHTFISVGLDPFVQDTPKPELPKTNVATYKTIGRLISLLNVASPDSRSLARHRAPSIKRTSLSPHRSDYHHQARRRC